MLGVAASVAAGAGCHAAVAFSVAGR